jgi:hypothetical protein
MKDEPQAPGVGMVGGLAREMMKERCGRPESCPVAPQLGPGRRGLLLKGIDASVLRRQALDATPWASLVAGPSTFFAKATRGKKAGTIHSPWQDCKGRIVRRWVRREC